MFLMGNFLALPAFANRYGVLDPATGEHVIVAEWQSALQMGGPLGALTGVFLAGPITSYIGYRWATIGGLMCLNAFILIFYFGDSLAVMFVSQLLEGIPWGIFIANAPAYCSEIVPLKLRAPATQMLQMFWAIGSIIVGGVTYKYNNLEDPRAFRYEFLPPRVCVVSSSSVLLTKSRLESPLLSSGCSLLLLPSSSGLPPSLLGGWSERDVSMRLPSLLPVSDVLSPKSTFPSPFP